MRRNLSQSQRKAFSSAFMYGLGAGFLLSNFRPVSSIGQKTRQLGCYKTDLERIGGDFNTAIAKEKIRSLAE